MADRTAYLRAYYQAHKSEYIARAIKWAKENPERRREIQRKIDAKRPTKKQRWRMKAEREKKHG